MSAVTRPLVHSLAICGGSGFIGRHLIRELFAQRPDDLRLLAHRRSLPVPQIQAGISQVFGDMRDRASLVPFLGGVDTVVNLAFMPGQSPQQNLDAISTLAGACKAVGIRRLVHVSTAVVAGAVSDEVVTEATPPRPRGDYEKTKLAIEHFLAEQARHAFELIILRPTAVFGPSGGNLAKLVQALLHGNPVMNYARSCFQGRRKMNLVCVDNVVAAIRLALQLPVQRPETFIVSDDDDALNNYQDVEDFLMARFGLRYVAPRVAVPKAVLSAVLALRGRSNRNPDRLYSNAKLLEAGFRKEVSLQEGLESFSHWCKRSGEETPLV